jgi:hypothetical protein
MKELLSKIETEMRSKKMQAVTFLLDPIDESILNDFIRNNYKASLPLDGILTEIYQWHNGCKINNTDPVEKFYIFPTYYINSIEDIQNIIDNDDFFEFKKNYYMPFFSSGHGEYLVVKINEVIDFSENAPVYCLSTSNPELEICEKIYDSVFSMFDTILKLYQKNLIFIDEDNLMDCDFLGCLEISKKMNPNSEYWKTDF